MNGIEIYETGRINFNNFLGVAIIVKICKLCGKPITNPKYNQLYHKEGDPQNPGCYKERMRLNWQQASSNYRLKKKKRNNNKLYNMIGVIEDGNLILSHDGTDGRLGTGGLGAHPNKNFDIEELKVKRELERVRMK